MLNVRGLKSNGQKCSWAHPSPAAEGHDVVALLFGMGLEMGWIAIPCIPK